MHSDPRDVINNSRMSYFQMFIIAITICLNGLDGFDILSISFASTGIAEEWHIKQALLGVVLSMELIGMGLGSFFLGSVADRIGRRPIILSCLTVMSIGMFMVTTSRNIYVLSFWRIVTGIGIGGMLAAINALTAEFSNLKRRHLCVSLMAIGYPACGVAGGMVAARLIAHYDWRSIFYLGSVLTACFIPLFYFLVPESVHWLTRRQPAGALESINKTFKRFRFASISALPQLVEPSRKQSGPGIFSPLFLKVTMILTATYLLHITTYYLILKWVPKIGVDFLHLDKPAAVNALVWANVGGTLGGLIFGLLTLKFDLKKLTVGILIFAAATIAIFGQSQIISNAVGVETFVVRIGSITIFNNLPANLTILSLTCMLAGIFGNAAIIALYAVVAHAYPTHARAFGTGFILAIGRGGAVLSPILVGWLLQQGLSLSFIGFAMCSGSLVAAIVLLFLKLESGDVSEALRSQSNVGRVAAI